MSFNKKKVVDKISTELRKADWALLLVDARVPFSSFSKKFMRIFFPSKTVIVFSKVDLISSSSLAPFKNFFSELGFKKFFKLSLKTHSKVILNFLNSLPSKSFFKKISVIGVPNVGKSTLLSKLTNLSFERGNSPGVTKAIRWIRFKKFILADSPGVLVPDIESEEQLYKLTCCKIVNPSFEIKEKAANWLAKFLGTTLEEYALSKNLIKSGNTPDVNAACLKIIEEFSSGKIKGVILDRIPN